MSLDFPGDVCPDCRHTLTADGTCPSCAGDQLVAEAECWLREQGDVGGRP